MNSVLLSTALTIILLASASWVVATNGETTDAVIMAVGDQLTFVR